MTPGQASASDGGSLASRQPRSSIGEDIAQAGAEVVLSVIPIVGSALQTTFASAANLVSTRQTEAWLGELAVSVDRLAATRGISIEEVVADPVFYEALIRGTRAAQATMRNDKLTALRAIVLNSGSWSPTPMLIQQICLRLVDELEAEHLAFLELFADPAKWLSRHPELGSRESLTLGDAVPILIDLPGEGSADYIAMRFMDDLYQRGLISNSVGLAYQIKTVDGIDTAATPLGIALLGMLAEEGGSDGPR